MMPAGLGEIARFELISQARRLWPWLAFVILTALTFRLGTEGYIHNARTGGFHYNAPFVVAAVTLLGSVMALLAAAAFAGGAATRDVRTRMSPLVYTTPVGETSYLGGRYLAALTLDALVLLAVPAGLLLALLVPGLEAELVGPVRPAAYAVAYLCLALPNAFVATTLLFSVAALSRRATTSYVGAVLLFAASMVAWQYVALHLGRWEVARLLDPLGMTALAEISKAWTPAQKNTLLVGPQSTIVSGRLLWMGIALAVLALTHRRFRFAHHAEGGRRAITARRDTARVVAPGPTAVPCAPRSFGAATRARQLLAVAWESYREVVTSWGGLALGAMTVILVLTGPELMEHMGVPLVPTTAHLTAFIGNSADLLWMIVPLLTVFYAGELIWRERDAGVGDIVDAAPLPDWVLLLGKFIGLGLVLVSLQVLMMAAGILIQALLGYREFEVGLYARILFGIQLPDRLLLALLALVVHVLVGQKYAGHTIVLAVYGCTTFASAFGVEHRLLVYGSDPGLAYSDMRGFAPFLAPWLWFKLYWGAWALLLAVAARLLWVRGREQGLASRLELARRRLTPRMAGVAAAAAGLVLGLGGFVFYNTNVVNEYRTATERMERRADYERKYGRYDGVSQPLLTGSSLRVEIYPARREVEIRGTYRLVNRSAAPIDSVHLATAPDVATDAVVFDRPGRSVLTDEELGHRIYALARPLRPGDSLRLGFRVRYAPRGFGNDAVDAAVTSNGTYFTAQDWLPAIGYQRDREIGGAGERRAHGLPPRPAMPSPDDALARFDAARAERIAFHAVVGTDQGQVAVAPGTLRRTWAEGGRRWFEYATDAPIRNEYAFYSAAYAVREARWNDVRIEVVHHPGHAWNVDRMLRSARASLESYTRRFGPYPYAQLRFVEHPGASIGLHAAPIDVAYQEGFALMRPGADPRGIDFPFAVAAHEVAHQWWGNQLTPARVEGAPLLTESLAWYSALGVVEEAYGTEHLQRLMSLMREAYLAPRPRAGVPLLRATDWLAGYRTGPFAMYALREYVGERPVNEVLRRLLAAHGSGRPPLATSLDLYRGLQAVTPDTLHDLLHDLFAANTLWELRTNSVTAEPTASGAWQVTLDVRARKTAVDTAGTETEVPMDDLIEVGVFGPGKDGAAGAPLYLRRHRIRSGEQRIVVTVPQEPARAGIDPRGLLLDPKSSDDVQPVSRRPGV